MKNGDLSNRATRPILFQGVGFLLKQKKESIVSKVKSVILGDVSIKLEVNSSAARALEFTYLRSEFNPVVVLDSEFNTEQVRELLNELYVNRIWVCNNRIEVAHRMVNGDYIFYVDDDENRLREARRYAITLDELWQILNKQRN